MHDSGSTDDVLNKKSHNLIALTDSSRGLKSVCKFKICKKFAKILHRR